MKHDNINKYIDAFFTGKPVIFVCIILGVLFLVLAFDKTSRLNRENASTSPHTNPVAQISKAEENKDVTYTFTQTTIASDDFALSTTKIVKFSFSEVLYLVNSYGNYMPLINEDGTPMTLAQFEEVYR